MEFDTCRYSDFHMNHVGYINNSVKKFVYTGSHRYSDIPCPGGDMFGKAKCLGIAQRLLDWVMGGPPFDSSAIEGVGYNQPMRACYGEFSPMQPQLPGAVVTELGPNHFKNGVYGTEYDLSVTGAVFVSVENL